MSRERFLHRSLVTGAQVQAVITLPDSDIRRALDEAVRRGWTEHTRRALRIALLLVGDLIAGLLGVYVVLRTWFVVSSEGLRPLPEAIPLVAMVFCIMPLALRITGAYGGGKTRADVGRIAGALAIAATAGWVQARLFGQATPTLPNKAAYLYLAVILTLAIWIWRVGFDALIKLGFRAGVLQRRALVIGHRADVEHIQRKIDKSAASDVRIVGALSPDAIESDRQSLENVVRHCGAHGVIIAANLPFGLLEQVIGRCVRSGVSVSLLPKGLQELGSFYFELRESGAGLLLQVLPLRFGLPQLAVKRSMDIVLTSISLLLSWPLFLLVAAAIKLDTPGPVFFRQERVGVGGRPFRMLKFRTMHVGADALKGQLAHLNASGDSRLFKIPNDPRITRVGRFLRRASLDELPQVFNVLRGEMSLVGPRPFFRSDLEAYQAHHFERLHVLPGITGLWQISGRSDVVDFEEVVRLDHEYIRDWSVFLDLTILIRTVPAAFGRGAY